MLAITAITNAIPLVDIVGLIRRCDLQSET
jgi:hypothetical protein